MSINDWYDLYNDVVRKARGTVISMTGQAASICNAIVAFAFYVW